MANSSFVLLELSGFFFLNIFDQQLVESVNVEPVDKQDQLTTLAATLGYVFITEQLFCIMANWILKSIAQ